MHTFQMISILTSLSKKRSRKVEEKPKNKKVKEFNCHTIIVIQIIQTRSNTNTF